MENALEEKKDEHAKEDTVHRREYGSKEKAQKTAHISLLCAPCPST